MEEELSAYELMIQDHFLQIQTFDEYLAQYDRFLRLPKSNMVFIHQIKLLEADTKYNHRKKLQLIQYKKMHLKKEYFEKLTALCDEIEENGIYDQNQIINGNIEISYHYPKGKKEAVQNQIAKQIGTFKKQEEDQFYYNVMGNQIDELITFGFEFNSFSKVDLEYIESNLYQYFLSFNRLARLDVIIYQLQSLCHDFRSIKSITIPEIKTVISNYQKELKEKRDTIYQELIVSGKESGKWKSEQDAFLIVHEYFEDAIFQYKPDFLHGQSIDIYIPSKKVAIEYQGKQHYEEIDFFGGKEALENNKIRDSRKKYRLREKGIQLIYWYYFDPVTKEWFENMILPQFQN